MEQTLLVTSIVQLLSHSSVDVASHPLLNYKPLYDGSKVSEIVQLPILKGATHFMINVMSLTVCEGKKKKRSLRKEW